VSLLWRDCLSVALYPDRVVLVRQQRGLNKRIVHKQQEQFAPEKQAPAWTVALAELDAMLSPANTPDEKGYTGCILKVVLSSQLVRYLALPALAISMKADEKLAYVLGGFHEVYGAAADEWQVQMSDAAPEEAMVAVAVDRVLLQGLQAIATKYQLKLRSVQPHLMQAFNLLSHKLKQPHTYFAVVEPQRVLMARLDKGRWQHLRMLPREADWAGQLGQLVEREAWLHQQSDAAVATIAPQQIVQQLMVYAPEMPDMSLPMVAGWHMQMLTDSRQTNMVALNERDYLMAAGALLS
jgi:hypothetical protein